MSIKAMSLGLSVSLLANISFADPLPAACKDLKIPNPVKVILPTAPANSSDGAAWAIFGAANRKFGISFVIDNRPGASGNLGVMAAKDSSQKDPNAVLLFAQAPEITLNPHLAEPKAMHTLADFKPVTYVAGMNYVLICHVSAKLPKDSLNDMDSFLKHITEKKISVDIGDGGVTNTTGLLTIKLGQATGLLVGNASNSVFRPIPYKSTSDAMRDVMGNQIDCMFQSTAGADAILKSQSDPNFKIRAVAIASSQDSKEYNLLAIRNSIRAREFGELKNWMGVFASPKMDAKIMDCFDSITRESINDAAVAQSLTAKGFFRTPRDPNSPNEFFQFVQAESQRMQPWSTIINKVVTGK